MGTAISRSGLAEWMVGLLPVEGVSVYVLMVVFGTLACIMSSVMSNTASAAMMLAIVIPMTNRLPADDAYAEDGKYPHTLSFREGDFALKLKVKWF